MLSKSIFRGAFAYLEYLHEVVLVFFYFAFIVCVQLADNATNLQNMKKFRDDMEKEVTQLKATVESIREKVGSSS